MKITVNLGNISEAIKQVENYRNRFVEKNREFLTRLAEIGVTEARTRFSMAEYDGTNDVAVGDPIWVDDNTIAVRASGSSLLFIEFGAGVHYSSPVHEKADEFGFSRGSYGQGRGKNDFWFYKGEPGTHGQTPKNIKMATKGLVYTQGNKANRCMWETSKKIRAEIRAIAKEVFGND